MDQLPRVFQANLGRLFERVILPVLDKLPHHEVLERGEATTLDQFLDRAAAQVDNHTGNEAAKAFALTLAGVFERQLNLWAAAIDEAGVARMWRKNGFDALLKACSKQAGIDLERDDLGAALLEMFAVANVVRHGEGNACEKLRTSAPHLWDDDATDYLDLLPDQSIVSEHLRIRKADLIRYVRAATRFWGLVDPLPMAMVNPPYGSA